jgi:hypothetical protein
LNFNDATLTLTSSTVTANRAESKESIGGFGGGFSGFGTEILFNTIVAGNFRGPGTTADDINAAVDTAFNNLVGTFTGPGISDGVNGNQLGVDVSTVLDTTLADNGGPTKTHALLAGSPAINAGDNSKLPAGLDYDQRGPGFARIAGGTVDIGAFEVQNQAPTDIVLDDSSVDENQSSGTLVGAFSTIDPDAADTFMVELVSGEGDTDNDSFTIDEAGNLKTAESFDFEGQSSYSVRVRSTDSGGLSVDKVFEILVSDVNEAPLLSVPADQIAFEDVDQDITGISVSDPDGDGLTVTLNVSHGMLTLGSTDGLSVTGNASGTVTLSGSSADLNLALASLVYRGSLNFSEADTLQVSVSDGELSTAGSVAINVQSWAQQAADLSALVDQLVADGALNEGQGKALKLNLKDNNGDAGKVQAFLNQVNDFVLQGILDEEDAESLRNLGNLLLLGVTRR